MPDIAIPVLPAAIIINTCNRPYLLSDLVDNVKEQMHEEDVIIIVNDGEEGSVDKFRDEKVFVIEHCKPYYALASGRNAGIDKAIELDYEWGLFLDDDVLLKDDCLNQHKRSWNNEKTLYTGKIVSGMSDNKDIRIEWKDQIPSDEMIFESEEIEDLPLRLGGGANLSIHLPTLSAHGGFNERYDGNWGYEDTELYQRLLDQGWKIEYLEDAVIEHRSGPKGASYYQRGDQMNKKRINEDHLSCFGLKATQNQKAIEYLTDFLHDIEPDQIIELGSGWGGLSVLLGIWAFMKDSNVYTYDINEPKTTDLLDSIGVNFSVANIFDVEQETGNKIKGRGRTLLICDNGNRPKEFEVFTKYLHKGDYVIVHDYAEDGENTKNYIDKTRFPITFDDLKSTCQKRDLEPCEDYDLPEITWGVFEKK